MAFCTVIWTKPSDFEFDPTVAVNHLGHLRPDGVLAMKCDGTVRLIGRPLGKEVLRALTTVDGGEKLEGL